MHKTLLIASLLLYGAAAHAADPAEVLGHGFGSLSCVDLQDPDSKATCGARALSNGTGCHGLSSQGMRDKCLDEALYPQSSVNRSRPTRVKPAAPAVQVSGQQAMAPPAALLSEGEAKHLEEVLGVNGSRR
ncbi:hypothetical protein [Pseudomonas sp. Au-Pse12]|uniref:hypothetical protein n=1 Tax=Pseudomonas sp. Au-Pse12 TaxID=2906459 RepID=UPI001E39D168|nr:hypothetical protein [Pseudomonas sp. Au-Pse12]MCE4057278.1 hypothetical protein [Pseudomonas sp. Au-Pse12]